MENETKKLHFQEIDWIIHFPRCNNGGKYFDYNVIFEDRKRARADSVKNCKLGEVLDRPEIDGGYPHTIGFFKASSGVGANFKPEYLELRKIQTVEELWAFLNALDI